MQSLYSHLTNSLVSSRPRPLLVDATHSFNTTELLQTVRSFAEQILCQCQPEVGQRALLLGGDSCRFLLTSLSLQALGLSEVPVPAESRAEDCQEMIDKLQIRYFFVATRALWQQWSSGLELADARVFVFEDPSPGSDKLAQGETEVFDLDLRFGPVHDLTDQAIQQRQLVIQANDEAAVIRSSGTTGTSKWVSISHENFWQVFEAIPKVLDLNHRDRLLCCLPLWHLYARLVFYVSLKVEAQFHVDSLPQLEQAFQRVKPTVFPSFPFVWELIYHRIWDSLDHAPRKRLLLRQAMRVAKAFISLRRRQQDRPFSLIINGKLILLFLPYHALRLLILKRVTQRLGGRLRYGIIGDASLPDYIDEDLVAMGVPVLEGYGSTEQMISTLRRPQGHSFGSLGLALPGVELRLVDDQSRTCKPGEIGEILVASRQIFRAYLNPPYTDRNCFVRPPDMPEKTYYRTKDLAWKDDHGRLHYTGRLENRLWHPGAGRWLYPELIENRLVTSRFIENALLQLHDGNFRLVIVPDFHQLLLRGQFSSQSLVRNLQRGRPIEMRAERDYYRENRQELAAFLEQESVQEFFRRILKRHLSGTRQDLGGQRIDSFCLYPAPLKLGDELTLTLKLRRDVLASYAETFQFHRI